VFIERSVFGAIGGFDPAFGHVGNAVGYGEETVLFKRISDYFPASLYYDPRLSVAHVVRPEKLTLWYGVCAAFAAGRSAVRRRAATDKGTTGHLVVDAGITMLSLAADVVARMWLRDRRRYRYARNYVQDHSLDYVKRLGSLYEIRRLQHAERASAAPASMMGKQFSRRRVRLAMLALVRGLLPRSVIFRALGVPVGTASLESFESITVHESTSRTIPPPRSVEDSLHSKFTPGSDPFHRPSGWFFERSSVVRIPRGVTRSSGATLTSSGEVVPLGPGLTPPPATYEDFYRPFSRVRRIDDCVATLTTFWDSNYFHWLFDILPRLELLERAGLKPRWIYAPLRHAFQRDTLSRLGYGADMIIDSAVTPQVAAADLLVPSLPGTPGLVPEWVCAFLRERLSKRTPSGATGDRRIYVSRAGARSRRIANESRVLDMLARYNFEAVKLETMQFESQVELFRSASCIVAPHGAGLANLVFCRRGASVIEILPARDVNVCYWVLSGHVSVTYHYLLGSSRSPAPDIEVDVERLARTVETALCAAAHDATRQP